MEKWFIKSKDVYFIVPTPNTLNLSLLSNGFDRLLLDTVFLMKEWNKLSTMNILNTSIFIFHQWMYTSSAELDTKFFDFSFLYHPILPSLPYFPRLYGSNLSSIWTCKEVEYSRKRFIFCFSDYSFGAIYNCLNHSASSYGIGLIFENFWRFCF